MSNVSFAGSFGQTNSPFLPHRLPVGKGCFILIEQLIAFLSKRMLFFALHLDVESGFPKPYKAAEERDCIYRMEHGERSGRQKAKNDLIEHNLRLVVHIAKKYYAIANDREDLISIGTIGLIKAANTFCSEKNIRFATYAARCIENEILMHFRALRKSSGEVHLGDPVEGDDGSGSITLLDTIADPHDLEEDVCLRLHCKTLKDLVATLPPREKRIISMRYGLSGEAPLVQREVADQLGISRSYVSRIEKKALQTLKQGFEQAAD